MSGDANPTQEGTAWTVRLVITCGGRDFSTRLSLDSQLFDEVETQTSDCHAHSVRAVHQDSELDHAHGVVDVSKPA